jgi:hypothetical protein
MSFARWATALVALVKPDKACSATPVAVAAARALADVLNRAGAMMDVPGRAVQVDSMKTRDESADGFSA